jgi:hypothetical protein
VVSECLLLGSAGRQAVGEFQKAIDDVILLLGFEGLSNERGTGHDPECFQVGQTTRLIRRAGIVFEIDADSRRPPIWRRFLVR